jgi:hypothetical protein
MMNT